MTTVSESMSELLAGIDKTLEKNRAAIDLHTDERKCLLTVRAGLTAAPKTSSAAPAKEAKPRKPRKPSKPRAPKPDPIPKAITDFLAAHPGQPIDVVTRGVLDAMKKTGSKRTERKVVDAIKSMTFTGKVHENADGGLRGADVPD